MSSSVKINRYSLWNALSLKMKDYALLVKVRLNLTVVFSAGRGSTKTLSDNGLILTLFILISLKNY